MIYAVGTVLRIAETLPVFEHRRGTLVQVKKPLANYRGTTQDGTSATLYGYGVLLLGTTGLMTISHGHLEPLPEPSRGDMDTKLTLAEMGFDTSWAAEGWAPKENENDN